MPCRRRSAHPDSRPGGYAWTTAECRRGNSGAGVQTVPDPARDELVAEETCDAGGRNPSQVLDRRRIEQAAHRLGLGNDGGGGDDDHDEQAGEASA